MSDLKSVTPPEGGDPKTGTTPHDEATRGTADLPVHRTPSGAAANTVSDDPGALGSGTEPDGGLEVVDVRRGMFGASGTGDTSGFDGLVRPVAIPGRTARPYGGWFDSVVDGLEHALAGRAETAAVSTAAVSGVLVHRGQLTLHVDRAHLLAVLQSLRDDESLRFEYCSGVSGLHFPQERGAELHAVYQLLSMTHNRRITLDVSCPDGDPHIPSGVSVYPTLNWHEREAYDFFGIVFDGHPALTRIEMPDDWPGRPQRKDYPLGGIPVQYKGATIAPPEQRRAYN